MAQQISDPLFIQVIFKLYISRVLQLLILNLIVGLFHNICDGLILSFDIPCQNANGTKTSL